MAQAHFYEPATSTIEQSHIKGYGLTGWYFFIDESESEVKGPFESEANAEEARSVYLEGQPDR